MRKIEETTRFKSDFKKIASSGRYKKKDFLEVVKLLILEKLPGMPYKTGLVTNLQAI